MDQALRLSVSNIVVKTSMLYRRLLAGQFHLATHFSMTRITSSTNRSLSTMASQHESSTFEPAQVAHAPNTCQSVVRTPRGDFLVQVAWPLKWNEDRTLPEDEAAREDISAV